MLGRTGPTGKTLAVPKEYEGFWGFQLVGGAGFEPATYWLLTSRSNQLSYPQSRPLLGVGQPGLLVDPQPHGNPPL